MQDHTPHGNIDQSARNRKNDYLYRISIKALIRDKKGRVLVVKESGRTWWDLPGGGMDHGEDIKSAITRELQEEVKFEGNFQFRIIDVDNPAYLQNANVLQVRLIFEVIPEIMPSTSGTDADEIAYLDPNILKDSQNSVEAKVYEYASKGSPENISS
ncbi:NUDIX hydrolase [Candidatus Saccharibacteria bacterium]|nr:NUDIX hydrolase [Candidatus Saccharibacteria bacterium]